MLTIILTSYNRPFFVQKAIESVLGQIDDEWRLIIQDDGSERDTVDLLRAYAESDKRIELRTRTVAESTRQSMTRYSVLINEVLDELDEGIVGYMCDNVEYHPDLTKTVNRYFARNPEQFAGYALHGRDVWTPSGFYRGTAAQFGHWNRTPPVEQSIVSPLGKLDHSQVFHRLPTPCRWEESSKAIKAGDGVFFERLVKEHGPIVPMRPGLVLTQEHLFS